MHIETEGAAIKLRASDVDQVEQRVSQRAFFHGLAKFEHFLHQLGRILKVIQALTHFSYLRVVRVSASEKMCAIRADRATSHQGQSVHLCKSFSDLCLLSRL